MLSMEPLYMGIRENRWDSLSAKKFSKDVFSSKTVATVLGVITLLTKMDLKRIKLLIIFDSPSSNIPSWVAILVNAATSSRLTVFSSLPLKALVIYSEILTKGYKRIIMIFKTPPIKGANFFQ